MVQRMTLMLVLWIHTARKSTHTVAQTASRFIALWALSVRERTKLHWSVPQGRAHAHQSPLLHPLTSSCQRLCRLHHPSTVWEHGQHAVPTAGECTASLHRSKVMEQTVCSILVRRICAMAARMSPMIVQWIQNVARNPHRAVHHVPRSIVLWVTFALVWTRLRYNVLLVKAPAPQRQHQHRHRC